MLDQLLSLLGANSKITVGVSVSPGVGLEMIEINQKTKSIEKYSCKPLEYDYSKREIANYDIFRESLLDLFNELKIDKKSNIVVTLPSVCYGLISLPILLNDDGVTGAIVSEVEQSSYIFKKQEPVISWQDAPNVSQGSDGENRTIIYGAIQQTALDEINAACVEIGCKLIAIESSPNSLLKTLDFDGLAVEQMQPNMTWNLMIINQNSYSILTMSGKNVTEFREEPLALRSFVGDEIYEAIITSVKITLQTTNTNYLYIVSETDMVSAEVLSMKIPYDGSIKFLESNKYVQNPLMPASYNILPNLLLKITPEVIGSGLYRLSDYPVKFNLLGKDAEDVSAEQEEAPKIHWGNMEIELTTATVQKAALIIGLILFIPMGLIFYGLNTFITKKQAELDNLNSDIEIAKSQLDNFAKEDRIETFDEKMEVNTVVAHNRTKLIYYTALGSSLPAQTWLLYLKISGDRKIDIIGRSTNVEHVYDFYKGMKMSVIDSDLRLNRLELSADTVGNIVIEDPNKITPKFYEFEITNMSDSDLTTTGGGTQNNQEGQEGQEGQDAVKGRRGFLFEDFLNIPKLPDNNNPNASPGQGLPTGVPQQNQGQAGEPPKNLPANLESIEKF